MEPLDVIVEGGMGAQEDRDRRMEKLNARSTSSENNAENDEGRRLMDRRLYMAAKQGDVDVFVNVLEQVADEKVFTFSTIFDQVSPIESTYFHIAANYGNVEIVGLIARHIPKMITQKDFNGDTALHLAARSGHWNTIEMLLKDIVVDDVPSVGGDIIQDVHDQGPSLLRITNEKGNTALHEALMHSQEGIACGLIKKDPEAAFYLNNQLESPLYLSVEAGYERCVTLILSFKEELQKMIDWVKAGKSPVHEAITRMRRDVLEAMLSKEPRFLRFTDREGRFPLHYAASVGDVEVVKCLLDKFSVNAIEKDKNGLLPIHWASMEGKWSVIKELLLDFPDPKELLDPNGRSIIHLIALNDQCKALSSIRKDKGIEGLINMKDKEGNTALHLAAMHFNRYTVHMLVLDSRVDLTLLNNAGMTALDAVEQLLGDAPTWTQLLTWKRLTVAKVPQVNQFGRVLFKGDRKTEKTNKNDKYKDLLNTLLVVSTLVLTVTFAAGFAMPGGYNNSDPYQGMATMQERRTFQAFVVCDMLAFYTSFLAVVFLLLARLGGLELLRFCLIAALPLLGLALAMMSVAFCLGTSLVISKVKWLAFTITLIAMCFSEAALCFFSTLLLPKEFSRHLHCQSINIVLLQISFDRRYVAEELAAKRGSTSRASNVHTCGRSVWLSARNLVNNGNWETGDGSSID